MKFRFDFHPPCTSNTHTLFPHFSCLLHRNYFDILFAPLSLLPGPCVLALVYFNGNSLDSFFPSLFLADHICDSLVNYFMQSQNLFSTLLFHSRFLILLFTRCQGSRCPPKQITYSLEERKGRKTKKIRLSFHFSFSFYSILLSKLPTVLTCILKSTLRVPLSSFSTFFLPPFYATQFERSSQ